MNRIIVLTFFFLLNNCANNNNVYWCGDHPCLNKAEKEAYFKKNMIVEVKDIKIKEFKKLPDSESIMKQAQINEKKRVLNEKDLAKRQKDIEKKIKNEEKRILKQEKYLEKKIEQEEKKNLQEEVKLSKEINSEEKKLKKDKKSTKTKSKEPIKKNDTMVDLSNNDNKNVNLDVFSTIVEKLSKRNSLKPYPDINDIPE